jgi:hypothetical protein
MTVVESSEADSPADAASQPQAGTSHDASQADTPEPISLDEARKLRQEAANLRRRLKERESELEQHRNAGLSELEKAQRRIQELEARETEWQAAQRTRALEQLFRAENAQYPELLTAQVDPTELDLAPDGTIQNGSALVSRLKKQYPGLFRAPSVDAGTTAPGARAADMNEFIRGRLSRR